VAIGVVGGGKPFELATESGGGWFVLLLFHEPYWNIG
jgi:hypothetical protein